MAYERNPDDPYRSNLRDDEYRRAARLDNELQPDPELAEGPVSGTKIAMFAVAIAVVLGAVFYGLNNTSIKNAGTAPPAQTAQKQPASPAPAPRANTDQGMTTGAAPARPQSPPASSPAGSEVDRSANPPSNK
jgi:hypothetical protein